MAATHWELFVDESGRFDAPDDVTVVGGVLAPSDAAPTPDRLRRLLRRAAPLVPWPIHAWLTRHPCMYALWPAVSAELPRGAGSQKARRLLERAAPERWSEAITAMQARSNGEPRRETIVALDRALRRERTTFERLRESAIQTRAGVASVARALATQNRVIAVMAAEPGPGAGAGGPRDGYLRLLEALFHRVVDMLALSGGDHHVSVAALGRYVRPASHASRQPLQPRHLASLAQRVSDAGSLSRVLPSGSAALVRGRVADWTPTLHPALVLADFVVNAARRVVWSYDSLADVTYHIEQRTGLHAGLAGVPGLAAAGPLRRYLDAVRGGMSDTAPPDVPAAPSWRYEQATLVADRLEEVTR